MHSIASVSGDQYCIPLVDIVFSEKIIKVWRASLQLSNAKILGVTALLLYFNKWIHLPLDDIDSILHNYISTNSAMQGGYSMSVNGEAYTAHKRTQVKVSLLLEVLSASTELPQELRITPPEYFLLVDSGANVHVLWDQCLLAHVTEQNSIINWGGPQASTCIAIGWLTIVTFCKSVTGSWKKVILTSGTHDTWVVLDAKRPIFSQVRAKLQGHRCILEGDRPGLIISGTQTFIPFVECPESGFCLMPAYPPPTVSAIHNDIYASSMKVINLDKPATSHQISAHAGEITKQACSKKNVGKKINLTAKLRARKRLIDKRADVLAVHRKCGHVHMKRLIRFKKTGKLIASRLPPKFLRAYRENCPLCLAMKRKRNSRPGVSLDLAEDEISPWQEVYCDSSGKFRVVSKAKNRYFTIFVDAKTGGKIYIAHQKKKHYPAVYLKFVQRVGRHPQVLYTDKGGEIVSIPLQRLFLARNVSHIIVPRGEHHSIGVAEKAIQDICNIMKCLLADGNIPPRFWDVVGEHATLINMMTSPSIRNSDITIFEDLYGAIPNLDLLPPVGCFAVRLMDKGYRLDTKLDPVNQSGVFLGFAHWEGIYGSQILTSDNTIVTARYQVAYDENLMPLINSDVSNPRMKHLQKLLGRGPPSECMPGSDSGSSALEQEEPIAPLYVDKDTEQDQSSDDDLVDEIMSLPDEYANLPPFNFLDPLAVQRPNLLPSQSDKSAQEQDEREPASTLSTSKPRRSKRVRPSEVKASSDTVVGSDSHAPHTFTSKGQVKLPRSSPITPETLALDKSLLIGRKLLRYFPHHGGAKGLVTKYISDKDVYELEYSDGWIEQITFDDIVTLLPNSWKRAEAEANYASVCAHLAAAIYIANAINGPPIAASDASLYTEPKKVSEAIASTTPDRLQWQQAIQKEYNTLANKMKCWDIVDQSSLSPDSNIIGTKWVFKVKYKNGQYDKHRARIVALGYRQRKGVDYFETFSPTSSYVSIRLVLALTALPFWYSYDLDAVCAFISAPLPPNELVYLKPIEGFPLPPGKCLRLRKTVYGLKQSPAAYYKLCREVYTKVGMTQLKSDECIFVRYENNIIGNPPLNIEDLLESGYFRTMPIVPEHKRIYKQCYYPVACLILVLFVDNNGIRTNCPELLEKFERDVVADKRIDLQREGDMTWFLSTRYSFDFQTGQITADQEAYIDKLAANHGLTGANACKLPMKPSVYLAQIPLPEKPDYFWVSAFSMIVGELMFLATNSMPSISFHVSALARYMTVGTKEHFEHAKTVLRYAIGQKKRKITWCAAHVRPPHTPCHIYAYADASWADVIPSRKSTYCYLLFCNNAVFSWKSAVAPILALSTAEAEMIALCCAAQEIAFCRKLANELGFWQLSPTTIYEDNLGAKAIAETGYFRGRSKHYQLRWQWITRMIKCGAIIVVGIRRNKQLADIGTAPRAAPQLESMLKEIYGELS